MGEKLNEALLGMLPGAAGAVFGIATQGMNDRRQMRQQERLQNLQLQGNKQMLDWQKAKELELWKETSYPAQMAMMKKAGINPALMYGMGGGGGTTVGGSGGGVSGGSAPQGGGEIYGGMGMGIMMKSQVELLKAQKENIEADTADKLGSAGNRPKIGKNLDSSSNLMDQQAWEVGLRAALEDVLQQTNEKGEYVGGGTTESVAAKNRIAEMLVKNKEIERIGQQITLMKAQGKTEGQVYENLVKDGKLKDVEIEWNALDLKADNAGKFLTNLIKWLFKR